jgi:GT2 family glycosyltransferase
MATVDVVIVTFDTREITLDCASRIADADARVIIVDNGSTDGTRETFEARGLTVVRFDEGVGFAQACNAGTAVGDSPLVLFLNSDVLARPGALRILLDALDARVDAVAAGGRLVDPGSDDTQPAYAPQRYPGVWTLVARVTGLERLRGGGADPALLAERGTIECEQPAGACLLVRRDVFAAIGGFDERFWFWYEDVDLARRLHERGVLLHVGGAVFEHLGGGTFAAWGREQGLRSRLLGIQRYAEVHLAGPARFTVGLALAVSGGTRRLAFRLMGRRDLASAWGEGAGRGWALMRSAF